MDAQTLSLILQQAKPTILDVEGRKYFDKPMQLVAPPLADSVELTTLSGLVAFFAQQSDETKSNLFVHVIGPTEVELLDKDADEFGRRRTWAQVNYPPAIKWFTFGAWLNTENFIIELQQFFQRVKIEGDNGELAKDLDYVLKIAGNVEAASTRTSADDGISQTVNVKRGMAFKEETALKSRVNLAPYRTFAEIDQPVAQFIFRARDFNESTQFALFEGDGGRWRLAAVAAIAGYLKDKIAAPIVT